MGVTKMSPDSSADTERSLYVYIMFLGNLLAVAGMTFLMIGIMGALGVVSAITDPLGGFGSMFKSATTSSGALYAFAFLASLLSVAASWKIYREGPRLWLLGLIIVFQLATAAAFHSLVSMLVVIPLLAAIYGVVALFVAVPASRSAAPVAASTSSPVTPAGRPGWEPERRSWESAETPAAQHPSTTAPRPATPATPAAPRPAGNVSTDFPAASAPSSAATAPLPAAPRVASAAAAPPLPASPSSPTLPASPRAAGVPSPTAGRPAPETMAMPPAFVAPTPSPAPASEGRRCADCGAPNSEDARFCGSCGSILPR
jgi:hypothetical protein